MADSVDMANMEDHISSLPFDVREGSSADLMNDPTYATNGAAEDDDTGEADSCRICRGEATPLEPLFYPCKCSGSIKFVHQDCLMEWLSHSQKKHCELCKTPFRFTKLYSPDMPQTIPNFVFFRHLLVHMARGMAFWLRACMVAFVWLGCLPWNMRQIWGALFWLADGRWLSLQTSDGTALQNSTSQLGLDMIRAEILKYVGTNLTMPPFLQEFLDNQPASPDRLLMNISRFNEYLNTTFNTTVATHSVNLTAPAVSISNATNMSRMLETSSLLSNVTFLKTLTRSSHVNKVIITTMEGQIITILVVICFILIFLIREWVVQQQPGINMGAGFNAELAGGDRDRGLQEAHDQHLAIPEPRNRLLGQNDQAMGDDGALVVRDRDRPLHRVMARPRRRPIQVDEAQAPNDLERHDFNDIMNDRERFKVTLYARSDAAEFVTLWRRAGGDPDEVVRIMDDEGLAERLYYWRNIMLTRRDYTAQQVIESLDSTTSANAESSKSSSDHSQVAQGSSDSSSQSKWINLPESGSTDEHTDTTLIRPEVTASFHSTDAPNVDWDSNSKPTESSGSTDHFPVAHGDWLSQPVKITAAVTPESTASLKGKEISQEAVEAPFDDWFKAQGVTNFNSPQLASSSSETLSSMSGPVIFQAGPSKSHASSDGLVMTENTNPLAKNNWTFPAIAPSLGTSQPELVADTVEKSQEKSAWKTAQDLRVQEAVQKGRQAQLDALRRLPSQTHDREVEKQELIVVNDNADQIVADSWDGIFEQNPVSDDSDDADIHEETEAILDDPYPLDHPVLNEVVRDPVALPRPEPQGVFGHVADWLWGDMDIRRDPPARDVEHVVQDIADEAPFVPVAPRPGRVVFDVVQDADRADVNAGRAPDDQDQQDREVLAAALAAGIDPNDPDALDDAEDFEGIMELIGMRGPLTGLAQNALFSAVLISLTVIFGVWVPYNVGRISLLLLANPIPTLKLPLKMLFSCAAVMQDLTVVILGWFGYSLLTGFSMTMYNIAPSFAAAMPGPASECKRLTIAASHRIAEGLLGMIVHLPESDIPAFSAISHEALNHIRGVIRSVFQTIGSIVIAALFPFTKGLVGSDAIDLDAIKVKLYETGAYAVQLTSTLWSSLAKSNAWVITLNTPERSIPVDPNLAYWNITDRFLAVVAGYVAFSVLGAAYLKRGSPFSSSQAGRDWEAFIIDILHQAGGVIKVILIISIEMLVFPLYCGLLLDMALMPLFDNATMLSRVIFTIDTPLTSIFVHWFVGTCYMFHFALFVSMCRKIMRPGVLYFIRDPDDPTFHPVRDVLERNVATQLRKITFSAMVYGALVVICLGGVVWSLAYAFKGVLPIHWSSNEPVLEFPVDLLFYNFFMPLAVKFFKPSDGMHSMYTWWFRKCARGLRLTWFLFDEQMKDEEGHHVRRYWSDVFRLVKGEVDHPWPANTPPPLDIEPELRAYFQQDGRYVRTPASDQVRLPKGTQVFLEVDEYNNRLDKQTDSEVGLHGNKSDLFKMVYVPPHFRIRVSIFILSIWFFAAVTGVGITIVPLVVGRQIFAKLIPVLVKKNDVYAFAIGSYVLGSLLYAFVHARDFITQIRTSFTIDSSTPAVIASKLTAITMRCLRLVYAYTAFALVLPILFALVVEFYFIIPFHTYIDVRENHDIQIVQSWTLGLLYVKLASRFILWHADTRPAEALRAVTRKGYWDPDIRIATRCFILPATVVFTSALVVPFLLATAAIHFNFFGVNGHENAVEMQIQVYRYAYPLCASGMVNIWACWVVFGMLKGLRMRIRDEVYLIGERLHNFGGGSKTLGKAGRELLPNSNRIET